jgi:hypothetical protein
LVQGGAHNQSICFGNVGDMDLFQRSI